MKKILLAIAALLAMSVTVFAQQEETDPAKLASQEAERLAESLHLEYYQQFLVDSTLQENYQGAFLDYQKAREGGRQNPESYQAIKDKWQILTEESYRRIFTSEQWDLYLRHGGARIIKDREKRQQKAMESSQALKNKSSRKK